MNKLNRTNGCRHKGLPAKGLFAFVLLMMAAVAGAQVPSVVFSQTSGVTGVGSTATNIDYGGTVGHSASNSRGDYFESVSSSSGAYVAEVRASDGSIVALLTDPNSQTYGGRGVFVDSNNNIYATMNDGTTYSANVVYIPYVNGSYPAGAVYGNLSACSAFPVPATTTATCTVPLNYPASLGYYVQGADVALDGSGNLYLLAKYVGGNPSTQYNMIVEWPAATNSAVIRAGTLPNNTGNPEFAVDAAGDVFYEDDSGNNYYLAAGSSTLVSLPLYYISGVSIDNGGNVYFTQTNGNSYSIIEFPVVNGSACSGSNCGDNQYTLSTQLSSGYTSGPSLGVAVSGLGKIYYAGSYPNSVSALLTGRLSFGSTPVNTTSGMSTLNLQFGNNNSYPTFGSFTVTGPFSVYSTTCAASTTYGPYATPTCSVTLQYSATAAGPQTGSVQAYDVYGNLIGEAVLSGTGAGANLNVDPGTVSALTPGGTTPTAVTVDSAGNIYIADRSSGKIYMTTAGLGTATAVASGFNAPTAIAIDGGKNLFVGESGYSRIVEVPYSNGSYGTAKTIATGLRGASALAVDSVGTVYVADSGNARVLRLSSSGNQTPGTLSSTVGSGFTTPTAVAIDSTNQILYVSDSGSNQVIQISLLTGTQATLLTGLTKAGGVAVDVGGSLFVADSGAKTLVRIPRVNGASNTGLSLTLVSPVAIPNALAADAQGNIYAVDTADGTVGLLTRTAGALKFGSVNVGSSSSTISATVSSAGTQNLTLSTPYYTASGNTTSFAVQNSSSCASGASLTPGSACSVSAAFAPKSSGPLSETLTLASNAMTAASLVLSGTGAQLTPTQTTLQATPTTTPSYGQAVTVTATVTPQTAGASAPSGNVTFYLDNIPQTPPAQLNGNTASITFKSLPGGMHSITASYNGDGNYASSASAALIITVGKASTSTTASITSTVYSNPTSQTPGTPVSFTAVVTPNAPGAPTGMVSFYSGQNLLGTAPVTAATINNNVTIYSATLTTSTLAPGQYSVVAVYGGDGNFTGSSSSVPIPILISASTIVLTSSASTIQGGGSVVLTITSLSGFANAVILSCGGLPQYATCSFNPPYLQSMASTPLTSTLTVLINQPPVIAVPGGIGLVRSGAGGMFALLSMACVGLLSIGLWRRRSGLSLRVRLLQHLGIFGFLLLGASALSGCGGTSVVSYTTPKGTSTLSVYATISSTNNTPNPPPVQTLQLQLVVN